jgi:cytochrome c biogenesis protein CcdA
VVILLFASGGRSLAREKGPTLTCFFSKNCHKCARLIENVMPKVTTAFAGRLSVEYKDIGEGENYKSLFDLKKKYSSDQKTDFPVLYLNGRFIDGRIDENLTLASVSEFINGAIADHSVSGPPQAKEAGIGGYFESLGIYAVMAAALADGINPCSFTVIVFFMSFLFMRGYRRRSIAVAGAAFIVSVFVTYLLIGIGLFGALYSIKGFWIVSSVINTCVGVLSIALGIFSIYDAFKIFKGGNMEDMLLQLPKSVKDKIHSVVGARYRADNSPMRDNVFAIIAGTLAIGFLVSIFESVCTGQLYLPTILFMLKTSHYKIQAAGYLLLYNFCFIIPLIAIFLLALAGVSSTAFSAFMKKRMVLIKILLAALFIILGVSLVRAESMQNPLQNPMPNPAPGEIKTNNPNNYWDFGTVIEGAILEHRFYIENNSKETLNIIAINTSCHCTASTMDSKTILPGGKAPIDVKFDTRGYPGDNVRRLIFVNTDSVTRSLILFEIEADIQKDVQRN